MQLAEGDVVRLLIEREKKTEPPLKRDEASPEGGSTSPQDKPAATDSAAAVAVADRDAYDEEAAYNEAKELRGELVDDGKSSLAPVPIPQP